MTHLLIIMEWNSFLDLGDPLTQSVKTDTNYTGHESSGNKENIEEISEKYSLVEAFIRSSYPFCLNIHQHSFYITLSERFFRDLVFLVLKFMQIA